jgi:aldehyde dehydrogenase (NAD+)
VIGPIINQSQLTTMLKHIKDTRDAGGRQVLGGDPAGLVLPPHVFADVTNDMPIAQNETLDPIAPVIKVSGDTDALQVANDTPMDSRALFSPATRPEACVSP